MFHSKYKRWKCTEIQALSIAYKIINFFEKKNSNNTYLLCTPLKKKKRTSLFLFKNNELIIDINT